MLKECLHRKRGIIYKRLPSTKRDYEVRYGKSDSCAGDSGLNVARNYRLI